MFFHGMDVFLNSWILIYENYKCVHTRMYIFVKIFLLRVTCILYMIIYCKQQTSLLVHAHATHTCRTNLLFNLRCIWNFIETTKQRVPMEHYIVINIEHDSHWSPNKKGFKGWAKKSTENTGTWNYKEEQD